ncbi:aminopeptidase N [Aliidiomarina soli]|uniref:Aminopeptidase N n=1 Tax=Aliidiomarina soli TaxID=1928574 RepID=A0A432WMC4_9GAMM|nr:aminopeptidase N [Aliidiomarina soli]RUO34943.1 aminopeptidase N [Aliidiomarina soli]
MSKLPTAKYRLDYQAPDFLIDTVDLDIELDDHASTIRNVMRVRRNGQHQRPLVLDGENMQLQAVAINGETLTNDQFQQTDAELTITGLPDECELSIETLVDPANNTALEGLYKSGGAFCTQCEAEGFRRITYYLDRPDVLAVFTTTLHADKSKFPYLLANGNPVAQGDEAQGRHFVTWHDPHPKPCYLFAVVAGDFDLLEDTFTTMEGRHVDLQLFVDKGNLGRATFAMESLKASMKWDEERFGLAYDLDIYMVVAVNFFNMGAMENKGLNVFNAKYVLADSRTATDQDFLNIESVIGHEYFHNWTGNRITCRDWFQLSLKEGLTVFRDQEFSGDMSMRPVHRINDVRIMRTHQFAEDSSPMAHPIRPDKVIEMNNFYTVTVYNKGAEVIRMMHTLLGESGFQAGMKLYVERHDGQAVTCEDFISAMEDANQIDFTQFRRWYEQAGTPTVRIKESYDETTQQYRLHCTQHTPATPGQPEKQPFHIPMRVQFYTEQGDAMQLQCADLKDDVISLQKEEQTFVFSGATSKPVAGFFAGFSAPVRIDAGYTEGQLLNLLAYSDDPFIGWDSAQQIYLRAIKSAVSNDSPLQLSGDAIEALQHQLTQPDRDPALLALLLQIPSEEAVSGEYEQIPVEAIHSACQQLKVQLATELKTTLWQTWKAFKPSGEYQFNADDIARRMLANTCLSYLALHPDAEIEQTLIDHFKADNLTDELAALQAAVMADHQCAADFIDQFAERWQGEALVMDKWLAVQAAAPHANTLAQVKALTEHAAFSYDNPNRVYALLATFTHNLAQLHRADGEGYRLVTEVIRRLNESNPQVASRLLSSLLQWKRFDQQRQDLLKTELQALRKLPNLANDLFEKVEQSLAE